MRWKLWAVCFSETPFKLHSAKQIIGFSSVFTSLKTLEHFLVTAWVSFENFGSGNKKNPKQTHFFTQFCFFSLGWNQDAAFAAKVKYTEEWGKGVKNPWQSKELLTFLRSYILHLPYCSQKHLRSYGFKKLGTPILIQRNGHWNG